MKRYLLTFTILCIGLLALSCGRPKDKFLVVSEALQFVVQGNGQALNFPVFAGTISENDILRDVGAAEYYYEKLKRVYDFKSFTFARSNSSENLLDREGPLYEPLQVYTYEDSTSTIDLSLLAFANQTAEYVFRISDKRSGQVRDHHLSIPAGKSASVGTLFDKQHNRGYLITVSVQALTVNEALTPQALADFLRLKNTPRGGKSPESYQPGDQRWMDELFPSAALTLPVAANTDTLHREIIKFDTPPAPVEDLNELAGRINYPPTAKADSLEGQVFVELRIGASGKVITARVIKGVRSDLDSAALSALKLAEFTPATADGKPVEVTVTVPVNFRLQ